MAFLDRMKLLSLVVVPVVVLVLMWQWTPTAILAGWLIFGYLIWRAWPSIRADITAVRSRLFPVNVWRF